MRNYLMGRFDLWSALGVRPYGRGVGPTPYGVGPPSGGGDADSQLGRFRVGLCLPMPARPRGPSREAARAGDVQLAVHDLWAAINDPLSRKKRAEVEEALAAEDARLWYEGALDAAARKIEPGRGNLAAFGAYAGALGLGNGARLASLAGALPAPAGEQVDPVEPRRAYDDLMEAWAPPVRGLPSLAEAAAKVLADAPAMPGAVATPHPSGEIPRSAAASTSPNWRLDDPAPYDALAAKWEAMLSGLGEGYARTAEAAFGRGLLGWGNPTDADLLRRTDARKAAREVEREAIETASRDASQTKIAPLAIRDRNVRFDRERVRVFRRQP